MHVGFGYSESAVANPAKSEERKLLRVGELAKEVGKSVRAIHLYEEMGLVHPAERSAGGFRLFDRSSVDRIRWILNLQAIGFSLTEIQEFVREFEQAASGQLATGRAREVFKAKLEDVRSQLDKLRSIEKDLVDSLSYLESCQGCTPTITPVECHSCNHHGHESGDAPPLFAGLSGSVANTEQFDVAASNLSPRPEAEENQ